MAADLMEEVQEEGFALVTEAARYLRVSKALIYKLMGNGELPSAKFGKCRRIPWRALREYMRRGLAAGAGGGR